MIMFQVMSNLAFAVEPLLLLAQEENGKAQPGFLDVFGVPLMMMIMIYMLLVVMPQKRDRQRRQDFINNLKKNDNVVTYAGIFGTIIGFSADGEQVTLRVDDNVRIRVRKSSIEGLVKSETEAKKSDDKGTK